MATKTPANASDTYKQQIQAIVPRSVSNSVVLFGDSRAAQCGKNIQVTSVTAVGTTATVTFANHDMIDGQQFVIGGADESPYNGVFTVTNTAANTFDYVMASAPAVSPAVPSGAEINMTNWIQQTDKGFFNWGNAQLGGRFNVVFNAALGGDTAQNMATRTSDVTQFTPDYCVHFGFINGVGSRTSAQIIADLTTIYTSMLNAGIIVIACTDIPYVTGASGYTAAGSKTLLIVNNWIRNYCRSTKNMILVDAYKLLVDGTSATGDPLAGMMAAADGIHLTPKGGRAVGNEFYNVLNSIVPQCNSLAVSQIDDYTTDTSNPNVVINGMMQGVAGTNTNSTGDVATSWTLDGTTLATCVGSLVSRADGLGQDQRIVATPNANNDLLKFYTSGSLHTRFAAGDTVYFEIDVSITSAADILKGLFFRLQTSIDGNSVDVAAMTTTSTDNLDNADMTNFVFRSNPFTYPAGSTITSTFIWLQFYFSGAGSATIDIGRVVLRK